MSPLGPAAPPGLFSHVVSLLSFAIVTVGFLLLWRQSLPARLRLFAAQSAILAGLAGAVAAFTGKMELALVALAILVIKGWAIPRILGRVAPAHPRPPGPSRSPASLLLGGGMLVFVAYAVMLPIAREAPLPTASGLPLGLATALIGLWVCVTARRALTQVLGFLVFENGVFMLALLATYGLPAVVEVGAFLDLLAAVLILKVVLGEIHESFDSSEVARLRGLRG
jgi:hydrogenase-4 component E